jgi:SAM-dependent methyltransferase
MTAPHPLLAMLDCPACRADQGLVPQAHDGQGYLACPLCRFWYPIRDEVIVLLAPERNPGGMTRPLGEPTQLEVERRPASYVDVKALVYGYYIPMHELGTAYGLHREPLVVDIGCSTGSLAAWLRPEQTYVGFDLSFESLRFARGGSGQFFVQADAERLPIKTRSVPFFVSREVLEHLTDQPAAVSELCRISNRGVIAVPTLEFPFLYDPLNWVLIRSGRRARFGIFGYGHLQVHDIAGWRRLVQDGGFEIATERNIGTGFWLNLTDAFLHTLYSWREFDGLPRRKAPIGLARALFPLEHAVHKLDGPLLSSTLSHAFEVFPRERAPG